LTSHVSRFLNGRAERDATGARGGGPLVIVTNLGILEPDENGWLILTLYTRMYV
jgi:glutaconate CoA-transferase subunit B